MRASASTSIRNIVLLIENIQIVIRFLGNLNVFRAE